MATWRSNDPLLRWLRVVSALASMVLVVIVILGDVSVSDLPLVALLLGAVLLQLGYEVTVPGLARKATPPKEEDDATT